MNLLPENASQNYLIFPKKWYGIYQTTLQCLSSFGCTIIVLYHNIYTEAHNCMPYGWKFWWIAEIMTFGRIYFDGWESLSHNDIHSKMANRTRWEFNWAVRLVSLDRTTPTRKQRTGCRSSSVSGRQRHQRRSLQRPRTHRLDCVSKPTLLPPPVSKTPWRRDILVRSCGWWIPCRRLLVHPATGLVYTWKLWLRIMITAHCKVLVDCSQNRQSAKINFQPYGMACVMYSKKLFVLLHKVCVHAHTCSASCASSSRMGFS